jgi:RNA ligase
MREALVAEPRDGKEGFVVHFLDSDVRVKIKQEDYIALHRIVTGLNARSVWQAMLDDAVDELIEKIPDEFHYFIDSVVEALDGQVNDSLMHIYRTYDNILAKLSGNPSKKDFAIAVMAQSAVKESWALFNLFDNKDIRKEILRRAKPAHNFSPIKQDEDSA